MILYVQQDMILFNFNIVHLKRHLIGVKYPRRMRAFELHPIAVHTNPRAFSKSIYRLIIEVVELFNSCFARFSHMSASFNWIQVMGIDVEWHPAPCLKTRRVDDGHIVGRTNANTG